MRIFTLMSSSSFRAPLRVFLGAMIVVSAGTGVIAQLPPTPPQPPPPIEKLDPLLRGRLAGEGPEEQLVQLLGVRPGVLGELVRPPVRPGSRAAPH